MTAKPQSDGSFELMSLKGLKEKYQSPVQPPKQSNSGKPLSWWKKVKQYLNRNQILREENARLQAKLLEAIHTSQESGHNGLKLYAENEALHFVVAELRKDLEASKKHPYEFNGESRYYFMDRMRAAEEKLGMLQLQHDSLMECYGRILKDWENLTGIKFNPK